MVEIINIFDIFFIGVNVMDDSSTLKQGSYFAIGIGIVIFILGIAAYLYF